MKYLDAIIATVRDVDSAVISNGTSGRLAQPLIIIASAPFPNEFAITIKYLYAIIAAISNINTFITNICHTYGYHSWWECIQFRNSTHFLHYRLVHIIA